MRYSVCKFPSYLGTPYNTRFYVWAVVMAYARLVLNGGMCEIRVIDTETEQHLIVL